MFYNINEAGEDLVDLGSLNNLFRQVLHVRKVVLREQLIR